MVVLLLVILLRIKFLFDYNNEIKGKLNEKKNNEYCSGANGQCALGS